MWLVAVPLLALPASSSNSTGALLPLPGDASLQRPLPTPSGISLTALGGVKIFNFGLPRTGTTSLHECLTELGLKALHSNHGEIEDLFPEYDMFKRGMPAPRFEDALQDNDAFGDLPWFALFENLMSRYGPDAGSAPGIFLATKRPMADWLPSVRDHALHWVTPDRPGDTGFWKSYFGEEIVAEAQADGSTTKLDELLGARWHEHYAQLEAAAAKNNVAVHTLDLSDAAQIPSRLATILGGALPNSGMLCNAYSDHQLSLLALGSGD